MTKNSFRSPWSRVKTNWENSDKYFHSKANFIASLRGEGGKAAAIEMSLLRELTDYYIKGDPIQACLDDMTAPLPRESLRVAVQNIRLKDFDYI
jgi:serum amyloid A protein